MKKLTLTLAGATLLAGSLLAGQNHTMDVKKENCIEKHKSVNNGSISRALTPSEKALLYIETKYGKQDDVRTY